MAQQTCTDVFVARNGAQGRKETGAGCRMCQLHRGPHPSHTAVLFNTAAPDISYCLLVLHSLSFFHALGLEHGGRNLHVDSDLAALN